MSTATRRRASSRKRRAPAGRGGSAAGKRGRSRSRSRSGLRRHRRRAIVGALVAGSLAGLVATQFGTLEDTIREVTLPLRHENVIREQARDKGVDADLIAAVIYAESRFRDQTSHAGARGLMQITPATARHIEEESGGTSFRISDLSDPDINIAYGTFFLDFLLDRYHGNVVAAVAAYNAGETKVADWGGEDLERSEIGFPETRQYVDDVLEKRREYRRHYGHELGLD